MKEERIARINELARKAKGEGLTAEELAERDALRREYIEAVTGSLRRELDNTYVVDRFGHKKKLQKKTEVDS